MLKNKHLLGIILLLSAITFWLNLREHINATTIDHLTDVVEKARQQQEKTTARVEELATKITSLSGELTATRSAVAELGVQLKADDSVLTGLRKDLEALKAKNWAPREDVNKMVQQLHERLLKLEPKSP